LPFDWHLICFSIMVLHGWITVLLSLAPNKIGSYPKKPTCVEPCWQQNPLKLALLPVELNIELGWLISSFNRIEFCCLADPIALNIGSCHHQNLIELDPNSINIH
jgi:hypothetical protein